MSRYAALLQTSLKGNMEADIKCLVCGRMTRHFELGELYYNVDKPASAIIVKEQVVCPKCKTDISQRKCAVKENYFLMRLVAATISLTMEAKGEFAVPQHLQGAIPLRKKQYQIVASNCKTRLQLVGKF